MLIDSLSRKGHPIVGAKKANWLVNAILILAVIVGFSLSLPNTIIAKNSWANGNGKNYYKNLTTSTEWVSGDQFLGNPLTVDEPFVATAFVNARYPQNQEENFSKGLRVAFALNDSEASAQCEKICQSRIIAAVVFVVGDGDYANDTKAYKKAYEQLRGNDFTYGDYFRLKFSCKGGSGFERTSKGSYYWETTVTQTNGQKVWVTHYWGHLFKNIAKMSQNYWPYLMAVSVGEQKRNKFYPLEIMTPLMKDYFNDLGTNVYGQKCAIDQWGKFKCYLSDEFSLGYNGAFTVAAPEM